MWNKSINVRTEEIRKKMAGQVKRILFVLFTVALVCAVADCAFMTKAKRYKNVFGMYTYSDVKEQYELLFQMPWEEIDEFVNFNEESGVCTADVVKLRKKLRKMGSSIREVIERYCRDDRIIVPFPFLIDYSFTRGILIDYGFTKEATDYVRTSPTADCDKKVLGQPL